MAKVAFALAVLAALATSCVSVSVRTHETTEAAAPTSVPGQTAGVPTTPATSPTTTLPPEPPYQLKRAWETPVAT